MTRHIQRTYIPAKLNHLCNCACFNKYICSKEFLTCDYN